MPHPITVIYKPHYRRVLATFIQTVPYVYYDYNFGKDEAELGQIQSDLERCIIFNSDNIYTATSEKINTYLNDFSVMPKGSIDEFKIIFFLARTLTDFLERDGLHVIAKVNLLVMLWLLDYRLGTVNAVRPVLTKQTIKMIHNSTLFKKTGEVGLYLTYKCLYKYAKEYQNTV